VSSIGFKKIEIDTIFVQSEAKKEERIKKTAHFSKDPGYYFVE